MLKTSARGLNGHVLSKDIRLIKSALADAAIHAKRQANNYVQDSFDLMKEKSTTMQSDLEKYITTKPFKAVGISLLFGYILALIVRK